ncbi:MAG TPA: HEPN domain-containing protein [Thermoanaerobaculia bacterium]|nr:HEPN domain-containing protein [Thermoanaerobaculia bacterium]
MDEARRRLVQGWLIKAQHDLDTARKLAQDPGPLLDTAIYHCQQAAEKAVKGFLAWHDQTVVKTHDVRFLVNQALAFEPGFEKWFEAAECVTPYATAYRYPDEVLEPEKEEFEIALDAAAGLVGFVLRVLPEVVVHPGVDTREITAEPSPEGMDEVEKDAGGEEPKE